MVRRLFLAVALFAGAPAGARATQGEVRALVDTLESGASPNRSVARLRYLGAEGYAVEKLIHDLPELAPRAREAVALALADLPSRRTRDALSDLLADSDSVVRMNAAEALFRLGARDAAPLLPLLRDPVMGVRRAAARAIGTAHDRRIGRTLVAAARSESEPEVRAALLVSAGQSGDRAQTAPLEAFLKSESESTRYAAAQGLCQLGAKSGFAFARRLLASGDRFDRRQGVALLEGLPAKTIRPMLSPVLATNDARSSSAAAMALYRGGDAQMLAWLVLASSRAQGEEKMAFEDALEALQVTDVQRREILARAAGR